jgi:ATP-dependent DNA helicase
LIRELKQYGDPGDPPNRLLITGTPLQNDMSELWSLLNYLMPEYFANQQEFDSLFDFSDIVDNTGDKNTLANDQKRKFVVALHAILKPFLLRRVKSDVESDLPKKREYILYAPLTDQQQTLYNRIREGTSRSYLEEQVADRLRKIDTSGKSRSSSLKRKSGGGADTPNKSAKSSRASTPGSRSSVKKRQAAKRKSYKEAEDDESLSDDAFEQKLLDTTEESDEFDEEEQERERDIKTLELASKSNPPRLHCETKCLVGKEIARKKLQNPAMQLRLACNSPHNFYWPWGDSIPDKTLVNSSGKLLMLDRLVPYLFEKGHKILIFSQFKTQLDILESWAALINGWQVCRIDGGVKQEDRRSQILNFNTNPDVRLFLLSTRAGGQGINLTAADTVILFDSDWNPQQDLQAQDRVHRIGQTRPVIVYRLATKHTIEDELLRKADGKRRLEKIVIQKGKFLFRYRTNDGNDEDEELGNVFDDAGFETYDLGQSAEQMLSEEDLMIITDRSDAAYERAEKGLDAGEKFRAVETKKGSDGLLGELDIR